MHTRIKQYLKDHGIAQTFVARKIGMDITTFNLIMNGKRPLKADVLVKICDVLGVTMETFREEVVA